MTGLFLLADNDFHLLFNTVLASSFNFESFKSWIVGTSMGFLMSLFTLFVADQESLLGNLSGSMGASASAGTILGSILMNNTLGAVLGAFGALFGCFVGSRILS